MKKVSSKLKILFVLVACASMMVPITASAGLVSEVLVDGEQYEPGRYTLNLNLNGKGKTDHIEFEIVNGDGTRKTMVRSVKLTLGSGKEKVVVISPKQFNKRELSNVFGTLGEDVVKDMTAITLDLKVSGSKAHGKNHDDDGDDDGDYYKYHHTKKIKKGANKVGSIQLFVREFYQSESSGGDRPSGW